MTRSPAPQESDEAFLLPPPASDPVHLLWTGGWDSTCRLLYVVLVQRRPVQPYYLIDPDRRSTGIEIRTLKLIRSRLSSKNPASRGLIAPVIYRDVTDLTPSAAVTDAFVRLSSSLRIGSQYEWLARFRDERRLPHLEMSLVRSSSRVNKLLAPMVIRSERGLDCFHEIDARFEGSDAHTVFRNFRFPLFDISKLDMQGLARQHGFEDLLELSWFCHTPLGGARPCGTCTPCVGVIEAGLAHRVPRLGRMRYHGRRLLRALTSQTLPRRQPSPAV